MIGVYLNLVVPGNRREAGSGHSGGLDSGKKAADFAMTRQDGIPTVIGRPIPIELPTPEIGYSPASCC